MCEKMQAAQLLQIYSICSLSVEIRIHQKMLEVVQKLVSAASLSLS